MELTVKLLQPFLVLPRAGQPCPSRSLDLPPAYDGDSHDSSPNLSSWQPEVSTTSSPSTLSASSPTTLSAIISLKVPSRQRLTSLSAKLVAYESIAYNNGGFEQSRPVEVAVSVSLPPKLVLQPGQTHKLRVDIPCPADMPPSIDLPDARIKYRVRVKAKLHPTCTQGVRFKSFLQGKTISAHTDLKVLEALDLESHCFSNVKYLNVTGLGPVCISMSSSPCLIGERTSLSLTFPSLAVKQKVSTIELGLVQVTRIRSRIRSFSASSTQTEPNLLSELEPISTVPTFSVTEAASQGKGSATSSTSHQLDTGFHIPSKSRIQPSSSHPAINVSHQLQVTVHLRRAAKGVAEQSNSYTCRLPIILADPGSLTVSDQLPPYIQANLDVSPLYERIEATQA